MKKEVLGKIFFTESDKSITGTSMRDPLGLQPIWSYYGRRVISHLTTVSTDISGFREVLLCLSICSQCRNKYKEETYRDLILLFEQLFVYSAIEHGITEGILGLDNGRAKYRNANKNPLISSTETILIREISLGYYGRYKTPLNTMGVIDKNSLVSGDIEVISLYGSKLYHKVIEAFEEFLSLKKSERFYKQFKASNEIYEAVCGKFRDGEKEFWTGKLQIDGEHKLNLMSSSYKLVNEGMAYSRVFDALSSAEEVEDIERLEPFLRCMEYIFYRALASGNTNDIELSQEVLREHIDRYNDFKKVSDTRAAGSALLDRRMNFIKRECSPASAQYIENIIGYHKLVCEQKHSSVWMEVDAGGNIQAFVQPDIEIDISDWGRDYYMGSLYSIKKGIEELSE